MNGEAGGTDSLLAPRGRMGGIFARSYSRSPARGQTPRPGGRLEQRNGGCRDWDRQPPEFPAELGGNKIEAGWVPLTERGSLRGLIGNPGLGPDLAPNVAES